MHLDDREVFKSRPVKKSAKSTQKKAAMEPIVVEEKVQPHHSAQTAGTFNLDKPAIVTMLDTAFSWVLYGFVFLIPLFFLPFTSDVLELNKQMLLFVGVFALLLIRSVQMLLKEEIECAWSPASIGIGALLVAWFLSSLASLYPYNSFVGIDRQEAFSLATLCGLSLLALLIAATATRERISGMLAAMFASTALASLLGLLQLAGGYIFPWPFARINAFNTVGLYDLWGAIVAITAILAVSVLIGLSLSNNPRKQPLSIALSLFTAFSLIVLIIMDDWKLWTAVIIGLAALLAILFAKLPKDKKVVWLVAPCFIIVLALALSFIHLPRAMPLPLSAQPTWKTSALLALESVKKSPFFGVGPGNFLTSYTQFRPQEINNVNFLGLWAVRFDQASASVFTKIAETGIIGLAGLLLLIGILAWTVQRSLRDRQELDDDGVQFVGIAAALCAIVFLSLVKPTNMTLATLEWLLIGLAMSFSAKNIIRVSASSTNRFLILSSGLLSVVVVFGLIGGAFALQRYSADVAYGSALEDDRRLSGLINSNQAIEPPALDALLEKLNKARLQNPSHDGYLRTLSQAILFKVQTLVRSGDQSQLQLIQSLTSSAIDTAKQAVALNGSDVRNVENLASAYKAILPFTGGADLFAEEQYNRASQLDPKNPSLKLDLAKMYLDLAGLQLRQAEAEKADGDKQAKKALALQAIEKADKTLAESLALKSDYGQAHYFVGLIRSQQNKKDEAIQSLGRALDINVSLASAQAADPSLFQLIAAAYTSIDEKIRALQAVKLSLNMTPDDTQSLWLYGNLLADAGQKESALEVMNKLQSLQPSSTQVTDRIKEIRGEKIPAPPAPQPATTTEEKIAPDQTSSEPEAPSKKDQETPEQASDEKEAAE